MHSLLKSARHLAIKRKLFLISKQNKAQNLYKKRQKQTNKNNPKKQQQTKKQASKNQILGFIVRATTNVISRPRLRGFTWRVGDSNLNKRATTHTKQTLIKTSAFSLFYNI